MSEPIRIGESVPRFEDRRFLTGRGRYTADLRFHGEAHMAVVRSPHASARITGIRADAALAMPGDRERCLDAGANLHLTKPVRLRDLTSAIEEQIKATDGGSTGTGSA